MYLHVHPESHLAGVGGWLCNQEINVLVKMNVTTDSANWIFMTPNNPSSVTRLAQQVRLMELFGLSPYSLGGLAGRCIVGGGYSNRKAASFLVR
jgi:hypothetical protein